MGKATLVERDIEAGAKLVEALDRADVDVASAFWLLDQEGGGWSLYIASPLVDRIGPYSAYSRIRKVLEKSPTTINIDDISAVSPGDRMVKLLQAAIRTGKHQIARVRFTRNVVNGTFIEDALIYRAA